METGRQDVNARRCQESPFVPGGIQGSLWDCMEREMVMKRSKSTHGTYIGQYYGLAPPLCRHNMSYNELEKNKEYGSIVGA